MDRNSATTQAALVLLARSGGHVRLEAHELADVDRMVATFEELQDGSLVLKLHADAGLATREMEAAAERREARSATTL